VDRGRLRLPYQARVRLRIYRGPAEDLEPAPLRLAPGVVELLLVPGGVLVLGVLFPGCELLGLVPLLGLALFGVPGVAPPPGAVVGGVVDGFGDSGGFVPGGDEFDGGVRDGVVVEGDAFDGDAVDGEDDADGCADDGDEPDDEVAPPDCAWAPAAAANASAAASVIE
jgi:hypothetical protein